MSKKIITLLVSLFAFVNAQAAIDSTWLVNQQNPDGSFNAQNDIAYPVQNTSEALQTFYALGDISLINESQALQIIDASDSIHLENIVRKIFANKHAGRDVSTLVTQLKSFINVDGGFGSIAGYQSTVLDTALVIQALAVSSSLLNNDFAYAVSYLTNRQNIDGSWSSAGNVSSVYITANVSLALKKAQGVYDVTSNINAANNFLINHLQNNIADTDTFETAQAVLSIASSTSDKTTYQFLLDHLNTTRDVDGSWTQDIYTTALAMQALYFGELEIPVSENLSSVVNSSSTISAVTGVVTDDLSGQVLAGVSVNISTSNGDNASAVTGPDGHYVISNLFPGDAAITVTLAGYHSLTATPVLSSGVIHHFNPVLVQQPQPVPVNIKGSVVDADTSLPLPGVTVQIVNSSVATQTTATGGFELNDISPGSITVQISNAGYISKFYAISSSSGGEVNLGLIALTAGSATDNFGTVTGVITDAISGKALNGVAVSLSGADNKSAFTDIDGRFSISNVNPGSINITAVLADYKNAVSSADIIAGTNTQFYGTLVKANDQAQVTIQGSVLDAQTQQVLPGVSVQVVNQTVSTLSSSDGQFQLGNITSGSFKVTLSLAGYNTITYSITADGGALINMGQVTLSTSSIDAPTVGVIVPGTANGLFGQISTSFPSAGLPLVRSIDLTSGQRITITASGTILTPTVETGPDGFSQPICCGATTTTYSPLEEQVFLDGTLFPRAEPIVFEKVGALFGAFVNSEVVNAPGFQANNVARGGDVAASTIFFAGAGPVTYTANQAGTLFFGVNDPYSINNGGQFNVTITSNELPVKPDLMIDALLVDNISTNLQTLQIYGSAQISVKNIGLAPAERPALVTVFEDTNANGIFDISIDNVLGAITMSSGLAINDALNVEVPLNGSVVFRDSPIYAMVDSDAKITESDETNNVDTTIKLCRAAVSTPGQIVLQEKWYWDGSQSGITNASASVFGPVMVGQLNDDNGDLLINVDDIPDAVFVSYSNPFGIGTLRAVSGADGEELWSTNSHNPSLVGSVALGDIDNDGLTEIIAVSLNRSEIIAYEHTGELKWVKTTDPSIGGWGAWDGVSLADLNHDGQVEILHGRRVFDSSGNLLWEGTGDYGGIVIHGFISIAADVDNAGDMEIIAGRTLYDSQGNIVWHQSSIPYDGFNAVGNFDDDDFAEIVLVARGRVYLLEHTGEIIWGPVYLPGGGDGGAPTVADFDGDGQPEIGVAGSRNYVVFETNGAVKWQRKTQDTSSHKTGSSLFDFEADGKAEILYADEVNLYIYDGATGDVRLTIPNRSLTTFEYPVIVDIDNDGQAEIVLPANTTSGRNGVRVFESGQGTWAPTRSIWNQHSYHINNINDDGSIPQNEEPSWLTHNSYRLNTFAERSAASLADITASLLKVNGDASQPASISVRIGNGGEFSIVQEININFYEGNPDTDGTLLGTVTINNLASGAYQDVVLNNIPALAGNKDIVVVADADNSIQECNELNNVVSLPVFAGSVSATLTVGTSASQYIAGSQVLLQGSVTNNSVLPGQFVAQLQIEDSQGNLIQSFAQHSTNVLPGQASINVSDSWDSTGFLTGSYQLRGQLFDLQGELLSTATHPFSLTSAAGQTIATLRTNTDKPQYYTSDLVQLDNLISNISSDTVINNAQLRISISNTSNVTVFTQTDSLSTLGAGNYRQHGMTYSFISEAEGTYQVNAQLLTQQNTVLASAQTSYIVKSDASKTIVGETSVQATSLYIGQQQVCTDKVQNIGDLDFASLTVQQVLIDISNAQTLQTQNQSIDLAAGASQILVRNISTASLVVGDYICAVQAIINGSLRTLDFAAFKVTEPPIRVEGNLAPGSHGQLLIWFEAQHHKQHNDDERDDDDEKDKHGYPHNNDLDAQRQYLEALLTEAGWAYTLVEHRETFIDEFSSGQYQAYLLLNGKERPGKSLEKALREAVNRGEGLIVTTRNSYPGHHESWLSDYGKDNALAEALGMRVREHHASVKTFHFIENNALDLQGAIDFDLAKHSLGIELKQAQAVMQYDVSNCNQGHSKDNAHNECEYGSDDDDSHNKEDGLDQYNTAASFNQYGQGRALYVGFDVLAYATQYQDKILLKALINQALIKTHPETLSLLPSAVMPIDVTIKNLGSDAIVQTTLTAPANAPWLRAVDGSITNPTVSWQYQAPADSERDVTAWLQLPKAGGNILIELLIKAGIDVNSLIDQDSKTLNVNVAMPVMLNSIINQIEDLRAQGYQQKALKKALSKLNQALKHEQKGKLSLASEEVLKATDELKGETEQAIINVRLQVDYWLRMAILRDQGHWLRYLNADDDNDEQDKEND